MSQLWYPGRPPFCTSALVGALSCFVTTIHELIAEDTGAKLEVLDRIRQDALRTIEEENNECLGTDRTLNDLRRLFTDACIVAHGAYDKQDWFVLLELSANLLVVRDELREAHQQVIA
jgi:hypothetical protein